MHALKLGIREFRSRLPHYLLEVGQPVAVTHHDDTIGCFILSRVANKRDEVAMPKVAVLQRLQRQGLLS